MYQEHETKEVFVVLHPVYGYLNEQDSDGNIYGWGVPSLRWETREEAEKHCTVNSHVTQMRITSFSCNHERQFGHKIIRGKNAGKWTALCVDCGRRSSGRPKYTESIAHFSLTNHPCDHVWKEADHGA